MKKEIKDTYGDLLKAAMEVRDQAEADSLFGRLVLLCRKSGKSLQEAEKIQRHNIGYFAGYYDSETRRRVEQLFKCEHPIFGAIAENGAPTHKEAFAAGMVAATSGVAAARKIFQK